jgi:5-methylcytosine-specific restriction enzyme subunit McrC
MTPEQQAYIVAKDCTPVDNIVPGSDEERWLREVCSHVDLQQLTLRLGPRDEDRIEPLAAFDPVSGKWTMGRYVGEVYLKGKTLRIEPRFGMPVLSQWLAQIWGIKFFPTTGQHSYGRAWLWLLLAFLWCSRLMRSSAHGLPTRRISIKARNPYLKGSMRARDTGFELSRGSGLIVSNSKGRQIDPHISSVIVAAYDVLESNLRGLSHLADWITPRADSLVDSMRSVLKHSDLRRAKTEDKIIRFTPMTELYRPIVALSRAILRHKPISGAETGQKQVFGVLMDIAEVWEYYLFQLLRDSLPSMEVLHTGRDRMFEVHLLKSKQTGMKLGKLYPDICIRKMGSSGFEFIIDAKYKSVMIMEMGHIPPQREDLYQITSYLAALGRPGGKTTGILAYPVPAEATSAGHWETANPWTIASPEIGQVCFLGIGVDSKKSGSLDSLKSLHEITDL